MARRDIIVIGCSLGGVEALPRLVARFSPELDASVFVVIHMPEAGPNFLPGLLRDARLPVRVPTDGERFRAGHIYAAVPGFHLMLQGQRIRLTRGPKESHARPSVDVLFRSAGVAAGRRVIGVVLTGQLDDGTAGLWAIKDRGGIAVVQAVREAAYPSMPLSALRDVDVDFELSLEEMPELFLKLTTEALADPPGLAMTDSHLETEVSIAVGDNALACGVRNLGDPSFFTCPECHGSMVEIKEGSIRRFRCHTGHAFSEPSLEAQGAAQVERTLWEAVAQLEEQLVLLRQVHSPDEAGNLAQRIEQVEGFTRRVRELALDPVLRDPGS